jgi:hypothetical protein
LQAFVPSLQRLKTLLQVFVSNLHRVICVSRWAALKDAGLRLSCPDAASKKEGTPIPDLLWTLK